MAQGGAVRQPLTQTNPSLSSAPVHCCSKSNTWSVGDGRWAHGTPVPVPVFGAPWTSRSASSVQFTRSWVAGFSSTIGVTQPATVIASAAASPTRRMAVYSTTVMDSRRRVFASIAARALWLSVAVLPACAGGQEWIYDKPRVTPAQLDQDKAACRKAAPSRSMLRTFEDEKVEREAFNRCMVRRGYTVKAVPLP